MRATSIGWAPDFRKPLELLCPKAGCHLGRSSEVSTAEFLKSNVALGQPTREVYPIVSNTQWNCTAPCVLIEVVHPADVLFFANPIRLLVQRGYRIHIASRDKDVAIGLLDELKLEHLPLTKAGSGLFGMALELIRRDVSLAMLARKIRPDVLCGFGGVSISHVGKALSIPAIAFYDTDQAVLQQRLTLPFLTHQYVPEVYDGPTKAGHHTRFRGVKGLSYLHPKYFRAELSRAISAGYAQASSNYVIRLVNWQSNHDIGKRGWSLDTVRCIVHHLSAKGKVHISTERRLPADLQEFAYSGSFTDFHHLLAYADLYVGESATIATEAVLLGVPSVYAVKDRRSYIDELAELQLLTSTDALELDKLLAVLDSTAARPRSEFLKLRDAWLSNHVDLVDYVVERIDHHLATRPK